ncbi:MAG: hypothetical protein AAFR96_06815 [Planctomycetota bacterium]
MHELIKPLQPLRRLAIAWIPALASAVVLGPLAGALIARLTSTDGGPHATLLVNQTPIIGFACALGIGLLAAAGGWLGVRIRSPNVGLFSAGIVLAWAAARSGRVDEMVISSHASPFPRLMLEGLVIALVALLLVEVIRRCRRVAPPEPALADTARATAIGLVAATGAAWVIAADTHKGQTIAAAAAAGALGAAVARMMLVSIPPRTLVVIPAALAIAAPALAQVMSSDALESGFAGTITRLGRIAPLDWLAGGLIGIPLGLVWTDSIAEPQPSAGGAPRTDASAPSS